MTQTHEARWSRRRGSRSGRNLLAGVAGAVALALSASIESADWLTQCFAYGLASTHDSARGAVRAVIALDPSALRPNVRRSLTTPLAQRLQQAFPIALRRSREKAECRALFETLGADGVEKLAATLYYGAAREHARQACRFGAQALTSVGTPVTWLCPGFAKLSNERAALALIHEALHYAGLPERPHDTGAMTSTQINDLVKERCAP